MSPRKRPTSGEAGGPADTLPVTPPLGPDGKPLPFEKALERLEAIVEQLEDGKLTLEDSIKRFEEGVCLSRFLEGELGRAEQRVQELVDRAGAPGTRPWADDDDGNDAEDDGDDGDAV
ncbi:MAG: exodeoxyribonuclease VII small subunit [Candidatus Eisenbacteria bacterium]